MPYTPPSHPHLPDVVWAPSTPAQQPTGPAARPDLEAVATSPSDQQAQVAADNAPLREVYGRARIGAQIADALVYDGNLVLLAVWCGGPIEAVESYTIGDAAPAAGVTATHYTGAAGQGIDATLAAAYAANGITYTDTLPGVAYSVVTVPPGASAGFPTLSAIIKGRKVYDPSKGALQLTNGAAASNANNAAYDTVTTAFTLEFWMLLSAGDNTHNESYPFRRGTPGAATSGPVLYIFGSAASGANNRLIRLYGAPGGVFKALSSDYLISQRYGEWAHIAYAWDGVTGVCELYVDGVSQGTYGGTTGTFSTVVSGLSLGHTPSQSTIKMREVRYWNTRRTATEITANMSKRLVGNEAGLIAYFPCDDGTGTTLRDWTSNANHATLSGAATWTTGRPLAPPASGAPGAYSGNPALWTADFYASPVYGLGRAYPDPVSVAACAAACDASVSGAARRGGGGLVIDAPAESRRWLDALRTYAGAWVDEANGKLIADRPVSAPAFYVNDSRGLNNLIDPTTWVVGSSGSQPGFAQNGQTSENRIVLGTGPHGVVMPLWEGGNDAASDGDGGWNGDMFTIDPTKKYRFMVALRRNTANGDTYFGIDGFTAAGAILGVENLADGVLYTNPYFLAFDPPQNDRWYLLVGHVFPAGTPTGTPDTLCGVYDMPTGTKVASALAFRWLSTGGKSRHRTYLYYATDTSARQWWARDYTRVDLCDGTELPISAYLAPFGRHKSLADTLSLRKLRRRDAPTVVTVRYTDATVTPWAERSATAYAAGVLAGTTPRRESSVALPGIQSYAQAYREAVERLNHFTLEDLEVSWEAFDEALAVERGDVGSVTHPVGLSDKLVRVTDIRASGPGRYRITAREYDPAAYSDAVEVGPTWQDTALPSPTNPPSLSGLAAVEEVYQLDNGTYASRLRVTWTAVTWPFLAGYRVEVYRLGALIDSATVAGAVYASAAVQEGVEYVVRVAAATTIGTLGAWAQANITPAGKYLVPGNVPSATAFEAGGRVYLSWQPAVDLDIWRYEVRYGTTGGAWDTATLIDRVDGLRLISDQIPTGTWRLYVKALDSVGQYSASAATYDVTVTSDASAFLVSSYDSTTPTWQNWLTYTEAFSNAAWSYTAEGLTVNDDAISGPFPGTYGDKLVESTTTDLHRRGQNITSSSGAARRFSFYAKAGERTKARGWSWAGGDTSDQRFDLSAGTCAGSLNPRILSVGNGWWRCSFDVPSAHTALVVGPVDSTVGTVAYAGTAGSGIYVFGGQISKTAYDHEYQSCAATAMTTGGVGMARYSLAPTDPNVYYVTEDGATAASKFPASPASSYTGIAATYHASLTSTWLGESEDFGQSLSGNWLGTAAVADLSGSHASSIGLSADGSAWTYYAGLSTKATARFARLKHEATGTATMRVTVPGQSLAIQVVPREEVGTATSIAANAKTVHLAGDYASTLKVTVTPTGATAASHTLDNIGRNAPNPADKDALIVVSGNTITASAVTAWRFIRARHPMPTTGKWYMEFKIDAIGTNPNTIMVGMMSRAAALTEAGFSDSASMFYYGKFGQRYPGPSAYGATYTTGDVIGMAYDAGAGSVTFYKNGVSQGPITGLSGEKFPAVGIYNGTEQVTTRWTTGSFGYAPPSGFLPLPYAFDVHIFNDAGTRIARDFSWAFQGV